MLAGLPWVWDWSPEAWTAVAAWATFAVAAGAAAFARGQVNEARRSREDQSQPFVVIDFEPSVADLIFMDIVVRNTGNTLARNVTFEFDSLLESAIKRKERQPHEWPIFSEGIPTLPPGREYRFFFDRMPDRLEAGLPTEIGVVVRFEDPRGRSHELEYRLDMAMYREAGQLTIYSQHHAAQALRDIKAILKTWTTRGNGVRAWVRDEDKRAAEELAEFQAMREEDDPPAAEAT